MCLDESIKENWEGEIYGCGNKLDELFARHQNELEAANSRAGEAEKLMEKLERDSTTEFQALKKASAAEASARVTRLLNDQLRGHKAEVDSLTAELASERALGQEAASKAQNLALTLVDLKNSVDDLQEKNSQLLEEATNRDGHFQQVIDSKDLQIQQTRQSLNESLNHAADLKAKFLGALDREQSLDHENHGRKLQIEQLKALAEDRRSQTKRDMTSCIQKINELEAQAAYASDRCQQLSQDHLQEVKQLQGVIEALQDKIHQIYEAKETELESQRLRLTQEHDDDMLMARETHEKDVQSEREISREQLENLKVSRDLAISELQDLHSDYDSVIEIFGRRLEETEGMLRESRPAVKEAKELLDVTRERCSKAESYLETAVAADNEKADIITAKDVELARVYGQRNAQRASLVAAKEIVAAINRELENVGIAHDEAISAEAPASQPLADSTTPPPSSESANLFVDQILDQIKTHNPHTSPERINAIAASLLSKYHMGRNGKVEATNEEIGSMLQCDLKKLGARCRDLTNRFKSTESSEMKNADISKAEFDLLQEEVRTLHAEKADLQERLTESDKVESTESSEIKNVDTSKAELDLLQEEVRSLHAEKADLEEQLAESDQITRQYQERLQESTNGTVFSHLTFTKEMRDEMREWRRQEDDAEDDQPRFEHVEVCTVPSKPFRPRLPFHGKAIDSQMAKANGYGFHIVCGCIYPG